MNNDNNSSTLQPWASFLCCTEGSTISPSALMSDPHIGNGTTLWDTVHIWEGGNHTWVSPGILNHRMLGKNMQKHFHPCIIKLSLEGPIFSLYETVSRVSLSKMELILNMLRCKPMQEYS